MHQDHDVHAVLDVHAALAELGHLSFEGNTLASIMTSVAGLTKRVLPGAPEVSVTLWEGSHWQTTSSTSPLATGLDERQYDGGDGPCLTCARTGRPVHAPQLSQELRWPAFTAAALRAGVHSVLCLPVPLQQDAVAAINAYAATPLAFDEEAVALAVTFAGYASVALANMHLYDAKARLSEQLQTALGSRAVIDQAIGIVMGARRISSERAFEVLTSLSQESNRKLRDVAAALVAEAVAGAPEKDRSSR